MTRFGDASMSEYEPAVSAAIADLRAAVKELTADTNPQTPLPRKKVLKGAGLEWPGPYFVGGGLPDWSVIIVGKTARNLTDGGLVGSIIRQTGNQPAKVLAAIQLLEAAAKWCRDRRAGRERHAREIVRQQSNAVADLEARVAWVKLAGGTSGGVK